MASAITDGIHVAGTLARAGMLRPSRPDRTFRALAGLRRWGPTLPAAYIGAAARHPHAPGVIDERGSLSFADIDAQSSALARGLAGRGVAPGQGVTVMCRNHRWFLISSLACAKLGAHGLYLNTSFAGPQVTAVLERERPAGLIYDEEFAPQVAQARAQVGGCALVAWTEAEPGPDSVTAEIATRSTAPLPPPADPGRTVILTSGTTGTPKGANRANPTSLAPAAALLSTIPLHSRQTTLIAAPLFHAWGMAHMFLGAALTSTLVLRRRFDPLDTLVTIARERPQALVVVPVMLQRILELGPDALAAHDTSSLQVIAVSGSALPGALARRVMDAFGDKLYNLYGSTEVAWASIASPQDLRAAPGTAGRPPRGTVVRILDADGRELPPGHSGRIFVANEMLFEGYTGGEDKARIGELMSTGDMGHFDEDGRLFVDGRDDDMIVSGGENVFPSEVENLLASADGVVEAVVVGVPDDEFGQRLRAYVVSQPGVTLDEDKLKALVRSHLARYKVPREILFLDELPRNATGKILKRQLPA